MIVVACFDGQPLSYTSQSISNSPLLTFFIKKAPLFTQKLRRSTVAKRKLKRQTKKETYSFH